jgi:hypothetical protein
MMDDEVPLAQRCLKTNKTQSAIVGGLKMQSFKREFQS